MKLCGLPFRHCDASLLDRANAPTVLHFVDDFPDVVMMQLLCRLFVVAMLLSACSATGPRQVPAGEGARGATSPPTELSPELLYRFMLAEIAMQRGQPQQAVQTMLELARETQDARVARRATELALNARMQKDALEAASLWLKANPNSQRARQVTMALLVTQEDLVTAREPLARWIASDKANIAQNFLQMGQLLARHKDKNAVYELMRALAPPYLGVAEVHLSLAQAAWHAGKYDIARAESREALEFKPSLELAALTHAQALQHRSSAEAVKFLAAYVGRYPKAKDARLNYARLLSLAKRRDDARRQFETLLEQSPKDANVAMAVGLMAMQAGDRDAAENYLKRALADGHKSPANIWLMLGQINEERKHYDEALKYYGGITSGDQYMNAQSRYAAVLFKQGKLDAARKHLHAIQPRDKAQRIQLVQAEANLLRESRDYKGAYDLLGKSLEGEPDSVDLLYDQAMIAEKLNRVDVLERNLRKVIDIQPDHAHAYNALGYTLADRNMRLPEARKLIEKALDLSPQDGYIIDSLGWVLFRMGRTDEALVQLRRAFTLRPEAEVGAHLGEVLLAAGKRDEALKLWSGLIKESPDNDTLRDAVKRLAPQLLKAQ
jgi:tetratricopeptide (TPR) repeat protein